MQTKPDCQPPTTAAALDLDAVIAEIDDRGYSALPSVISPRRADQVRTVLEGLLAAEIDDGARERKHQRVGGIAHKHPVFLELMCHPLIVSLWKRYLGDDIMCSSWTANTLYPGHDAIGWHADYPFWSLKPPWPTGRFAGQTMWLLDDFTEENGPPGSSPSRIGRDTRPTPPPTAGAPKARSSPAGAARWWWPTAPGGTRRGRTAATGRGPACSACT